MLIDINILLLIKYFTFFYLTKKQTTTKFNKNSKNDNVTSISSYYFHIGILRLSYLFIVYGCLFQFYIYIKLCSY